MKHIFIIIIFLWLILPFGYSNRPESIILRNLSAGYQVYSVVKLNRRIKLINIVWIKGSLIKLSWYNQIYIIPVEEYFKMKIGDLLIIKEWS